MNDKFKQKILELNKEYENTFKFNDKMKQKFFDQFKSCVNRLLFNHEVKYIDVMVHEKLYDDFLILFKEFENQDYTDFRVTKNYEHCSIVNVGHVVLTISTVSLELLGNVSDHDNITDCMYTKINIYIYLTDGEIKDIIIESTY